MSISPLKSAFKSICPRCGEGKLFAGLLRISPLCSRCGLNLASYDLGDGPAVFVILMAGMLICFSAAMLELFAHPPLWLHMVIWPPVVVVVSILMLRAFKGWLIAMHYRLKSRGVKDD